MGPNFCRSPSLQKLRMSSVGWAAAIYKGLLGLKRIDESLQGFVDLTSAIMSQDRKK